MRRLRTFGRTEGVGTRSVSKANTDALSRGWDPGVFCKPSSPPIVWFYVGMAGAFCFILIQLVLLIDFAHSWNESWVEKMEEGNSRCWYAGKLS